MTLVLQEVAPPPAVRGWLGAHIAFRRDAAALVGAVAALAPSDVTGAARLADAFAVTTRMLHEHHTSEDEMLFPEIIERSPAFAGIVMTMSLEHVDLDDVVDDLTRSLSVLAVATSRATEVHARLAGQAATFAELIDSHLSTEEEYVVPMLTRHFSDADLDAMRDAHFARNAEHLPEMIPWAASALPAEAATEMIAAMPDPVRTNFDQWSAAFGRVFAPLLSAQYRSMAAA